MHLFIISLKYKLNRNSSVLTTRSGANEDCGRNGQTNLAYLKIKWYTKLIHWYT